MANLEVNLNQARADFNAIREKFIEKGVEMPNGIPTSAYANKVNEVYEVGFADSEENIAELNDRLEQTLYGTDTGGKSHYDEFWDAYQDNGNRYNYQYGAFGGIGWTDKTFKPKYPLKPKHCYQMFQGCLITEIKDIDFSTAANFNNVFAYSSIKKIGLVEIPLATTMDNTFSGCTKLHTIEKIVISENCTIKSTFLSCTALENITFAGTIANDISFKDSILLTKDSITNIINHLSDTTTGKTLTLSATTIYNAFGASPQDWDGDGNKEGWVGSTEWVNLVATKPNWTITAI